MPASGTQHQDFVKLGLAERTNSQWVCEILSPERAKLRWRAHRTRTGALSRSIMWGTTGLITRSLPLTAGKPSPRPAAGRQPQAAQDARAARSVEASVR